MSVAPVAAKAVDVNVYLSRYPFRRLPLDEPAALVDRLRALGVVQAWAGSFDALLHKDVAGVNARLAADCRAHGGGGNFLVPFGAINPMLPDWREDVRRCAEDHGMPGVRLHPNYHGYKLDGPEFAEVLEEAAGRKLIVQIVDHVEDERTHHPRMQVPAVEWGPLAKVLPRFAGLRVVLLNALRIARGEPLQSVTKLEHVYLDVAALEQVGAIRNVIDRFPAERILFGTYAPFFHPESSVLKLVESDLQGELLGKVAGGNARRLLGR